MKPVQIEAQILVTMLEDMANPNPRGGPGGHNYRLFGIYRALYLPVSEE